MHRPVASSNTLRNAAIIQCSCSLSQPAAIEPRLRHTLQDRPGASQRIAADPVLGPGCLPGAALGARREFFSSRRSNPRRRHISPAGKSSSTSPASPWSVGFSPLPACSMPPPAPVNSSCRRTSIAFGALLDDPELIEDRIECFYARFFQARITDPAAQQPAIAQEHRAE
jgi:hypothetical protein